MPTRVRAIVVVVILGALFADLIAPYNPLQTSLRFRSRPPSGQFLLGTDEQGRDILSRILFGFRVTLLTGSAGLAIGLSIGALIGLLAACFRRLDTVLMRLIDVI